MKRKLILLMTAATAIGVLAIGASTGSADEARKFSKQGCAWLQFPGSAIKPLNDPYYAICRDWEGPVLPANL